MAERPRCGNFVHYFPTAERCVCGQQEGYTLVPLSEYHAVFRRMAAAESERDRLQAALREIVLGGATLGQEPTRIAYEEPRPKGSPLRDAFVFCGNITDHGHASGCPWQAALIALAPSAEPGAGGERR